jgi:hypothetical protein
MEPARIKLYGLFRVTRRGYLVQLAMALLMLTSLLAIRYVMPPVSVKNDEIAPRGKFLLALLANLHWVVVGFAVLFCLEAWIVLRRFAQIEAQSKRPAETAPAPPPVEAPRPTEHTG